jgi:3-dehydroquinate synthetase/shikimate kinase
MTTTSATVTVRPLVPPVVLLGPPGAGKSTIGRQVAARLGFTFVDLDDDAGVRHLVDGGEADFRVREFEALRAALSLGAVVVAAGAGVVDTGPARDALARACCVGVDVDVDVALARIPDGTRPWLPDRGEGCEDARRAAWLRREDGRAARRSSLCGSRVVDGRALVEDVAAAVERHVRRAAVGATPVAEATTLDGDGAIASGFVIADAVVAARLARVDHVVDDAARKDAARLFELLAALSRGGVGRHDRVVVVGGGALLDTGGLAAALHHRGTPWVAVPTTLLSMVDAAVGGKTAVDVDVDGVVVRNAAGAFHDPVSTVLDRRFLSTLSPAQLRHGRAEMVKHTLLAGDDVDAAAAGVVDDEALLRTRSIKRFVVQRDPREAWLRMALNLGHTFAHALESRFGLPHGDAVLHGLGMALHASVDVAGLDATFAQQAWRAIAALGAPALPAFGDDDVSALVASMRRDKKARAGVRLVLLAAPGCPVLADVDDDVVLAALRRAGGSARV